MSEMTHDQTQTTEAVPPPVEPAPEPIQEPDTTVQPLNVEDDAAVDAALAEAEVKLPDGDALVSGQKAGEIARSYRGKIREMKAELERLGTTAARAEQLEAQIAQLQNQVQQLSPYMQAYQAMTQAAQQTATPEDDTEAEEYAKLLDLYTPEGKPDVGRAKKAIALFDKRAEQHAQKHVAPLQHTQVQRESAMNLAKAKNTNVNGVKADPAVLDAVWSQLDPNVTATVEGARHAFVQALGLSQIAAMRQPAGQPRPRGANGQFAPQAPPDAPPDPLFTEKAGGRDTPTALPLSPQEQAYIKQAGMTEKEYMESVKSAPWLRR